MSYSPKRVVLKDCLMPADEREIQEALEEGIKLYPMVSPIAIMGDGHVEKMQLVHLQPGSFDSTGGRKSVVIEGSEFEMDFDMIIPAVSQHSDLPFIDKDEVEMTEWGTFVVDTKNQMTRMQGVFSGGDVVRGPDLVIWAIADGKKAAQSIDLYLGGNGVLNTGEEISIPLAEEETEVSEHERFPM